MIKSILFFSSDSITLKTFRLELILEFQKLGYTVCCVSSQDENFSEVKAFLKKYNVILYPIPLKNVSFNFFRDIISFCKFIKIVRLIKPEYILAFRIKPILYSALLTYIFKKIQVYPTFTGLGYGLTVANRFVKKILFFIFTILLRKCPSVFFQNQDDASLFIESRIVDFNQVAIVSGSGVNLACYPFSLPPEKLSFLFVGRMIRDKGINEYLEASWILKKKYPDVSFKLIGTISKNPNAIQCNKVKLMKDNKVIDLIPSIDNIREPLEKCSVFVLPSYREGVPRAGIEALSTGRAIITTDVPGCREIIDNDKNGVLIPPQDIESLVKAMELFIESPNLVISMGSESYQLAKKKFDVKIVNQHIINVILKNAF